MPDSLCGIGSLYIAHDCVNECSCCDRCYGDGPTNFEDMQMDIEEELSKKNRLHNNH